MRTVIGGSAWHSFAREEIEVDLHRYTHFVVPLRDPGSIWQSYCSREGTPHHVKHSMEECFEGLLYWNERLPLFFCPVDLGDRSKELSEYLGKEVSWVEKVGHIPERNYRERDLSWFYELPFMGMYADR